LKKWDKTNLLWFAIGNNLAIKQTIQSKNWNPFKKWFLIIQSGISDLSSIKFKYNSYENNNVISENLDILFKIRMNKISYIGTFGIIQILEILKESIRKKYGQWSKTDTQNWNWISEQWALYD
jgi:hypothetical protein